MDAMNSAQSRFGLGLAALGRPGYINLGHAQDLRSNYAIGAMRKNAHAVLDAAWEGGIRYFDTARSYGRAEEFLASWIRDRGIKPNEIKVGSKWGYTYTAAWRVQTSNGIPHEIKRHTLEVLQAQFPQSMKNLATHLDLYQIHSAALESGVLENQEVLNCLHGISRSGIRIGLTVTGPNQAAVIEKALQIRFDNELLFKSVQATWNILETSATEALQKAHDSGVQVIVKEGLANGRLTSRNQQPEFAGKLAKLEGLALELGSTLDALALSAAIHQSWASIVLSGAACVTHLESNLKATETPWSDDLETALKSVCQAPEEYWSERAKLVWN